MSRVIAQCLRLASGNVWLARGGMAIATRASQRRGETGEELILNR